VSEPFLFSVPSGEPVEIEPFHYAIVGQTQYSGKTTLIKRLATWAEDRGFRILIFDTKETVEDYSGFGREVPVCLRETTDSFVLIGLLESMFRRRLTPYYATLSRLTEGAKGFQDIISRAREMEAKTRSSWLRDACRVLYDLLERLQSETSKVKAMPTLQLHEGINRMVINDFSLEAQQLIVKNAFEDALRRYKRKLILVLDEAFKFIPQGYSSPATRAVMQVITQGAKTGLYTWISTQFLAVTDKDPLKACAIKFLGTQDHTTEIKHTLDLIPEARGRFSKDDIMRLKLGHWILVRKRPPDVRVVYAVPAGVPSSVGRKVAVGAFTPEHVRDVYLKKKEIDEDLVWKEKYEQLEKEFKKLKSELHSLREAGKVYEDTIKSLTDTISKFEAENKRLRELKRLSEEERQHYEQLKTFYLEHRSDVETKPVMEKRIKQLSEELKKAKEELKAFNDLREALAKILPAPRVQIPAGSESTSPSEISVNMERPIIQVKVERKPLQLTDKDLHGKIAIIYSEGVLGDGWFSVSDVVKAFQRHAWPRDPRTSKALDDFARWGYLEKKYAGRKPIYHVLIKPEDARAKGLLKVEEVLN